MRAQAWIALIAMVTMGLTGCASLAPRADGGSGKGYKPPINCPDDMDPRTRMPRPCTVFIEPFTGWAPESVTVNFERENGRPKDRRIMEWNAFPFLFADPGIRFDAKSREVISCKRESWRWWLVTCENKGDVGDYSYTIDLIGAPPTDPWVFNR